MEFKGQTVMVTGGARGIGKAIAESFARRGANIAVADVSLEIAGETAQELTALGIRSKAGKLDVSKSGEVVGAFEEVMKEFGSIDDLDAGFEDF